MDVKVNLSDYYSAGYRLIKPIPRRVDMSEELFPEKIISDSPCICLQFPDTWCIDWASTPEELANKAKEIGVREKEVQNLFKWSDEAAQSYEWPGIFYTLDSALAARTLFFDADSDIATVGFGLNKSLVEYFVSKSTPPPPKPGFAPDGECAYSIIVKRGEQLAGGAQILGFEPREFRLWSLRCSWLCNGLQKDLLDRFNETPNEYGFITDFDIANNFCEKINSGNIPAEPGLWLPWLMVRYD